MEQHFWPAIMLHSQPIQLRINTFWPRINFLNQPQQPSSWPEAFQQLETFLQSLERRDIHGKRVVFLDELPWLNTPRSRFLSSLEHFWNSWASRQRDIILVICGSAASWMVQNIVRARGGLHNRLTSQIRLLPFTLGETEIFLHSRGVNLTQLQVVELYMIMGGIPHYLKQAESPWRHQSTANSEIPGTQIDLLIDRRDDTINLCEMKYSGSEFIINKSYAQVLRQKLDVFRRVTGTRKNVFLTMVTPFGVVNNPYAKELVANSLTIKDLF